MLVRIIAAARQACAAKDSSLGVPLVRKKRNPPRALLFASVATRWQRERKAKP